MAKTYKDYLTSKAAGKEIQELTTDEIVAFTKNYLAESGYTFDAFHEVSYMSRLKNQGISDTQQSALRKLDLQGLAKSKGVDLKYSDQLIEGFVALNEERIKLESEKLRLQQERANFAASRDAVAAGLLKNQEELELRIAANEARKAELDKQEANIKALLAKKGELGEAERRSLTSTAESLRVQLANKENELQETIARIKATAELEAEKKYVGIVSDLKQSNAKKDGIIDKYKGKSKRRGIATAILSGALALSIGGGIINGIHDENQIKDLESKIKGLNDTNYSYVLDIEKLNKEISDIKDLYAELKKENEELKSGNATLDEYSMDADELITAFQPLVEGGVLTQEQVDSLKSEDGSIDLSILVNVDETGYLYSLAMDKMENESFKKALDEKLNDTLEIVDAKVEDKDGKEIDATLEYFTDENGYVDSTGIIEEINESLVEYRNNLQTAYETLSSVTSDGTVTLSPEALNSIMTLRDVTDAIVDTAEDAVDAYNTIVEDNNDLTAQLQNANSIKDSLQAQITEKDQVIEDKNAEIAEKDQIIAEKDQQIEDLENSINDGIESGTTGDSSETESGQTPATPSGDSDNDKENNKESNTEDKDPSKGNQGGVELGG